MYKLLKNYSTIFNALLKIKNTTLSSLKIKSLFLNVSILFEATSISKKSILWYYFFPINTVSNKSNSVPLRLQFTTLLGDTEDPFNLSRRPWLASNNQETLPWKRMYKKPYGTDNLGTYERLVCAVFKAYVLF
ncbi:hypothetical protein CEXT_217271 [Caerostris extrusa]|uniref:Uncharacterized protein n=1 Tax=Caerostris extrusa TaxID=172846 RepID=A0AAV4Y956_CAEEX|nr:hypothetical protein CEXT_217271 [Caerostris extrusa]